MVRTARAIVVMVALCFLTLLALAPAPASGSVHAPGAASPSMASSSSPSIALPVLGTAPDRDCYSSPNPVARPVARPTDRNRLRRAGADTRSDPAPAALALSTATMTDVPVDRAPGGRLVDLRALSAPCVLRVIRS